jgi:hypothetical protein
MLRAELVGDFRGWSVSAGLNVTQPGADCGVDISLFIRRGVLNAPEVEKFVERLDRA